MTRFAMLALVACSPRYPANTTLTDLPTLDPVKREFNAHRGETRFLTLLSPTCPPCIKGAHAVRDHVVGKLRVIVAWIPMLDDDERDSAEGRMSLFPQTPQFWDGEKHLGDAVRASLDLGEGPPSWDIYLVYDRDAEWIDRLPKPSRVVLLAHTVPAWAKSHDIEVTDEQHIDEVIATIRR